MLRIRGDVIARLARAAGALLLSLACPPALAGPPMLPAGDSFEIADGVHLIPDRGVPLVPNVGIVVGEKSVLVVDTGMGPKNAEIAQDEIRAVTDLPIRFLVTTHFHPEHNYGAQAFPDESILVYATAQHRDLQRKGEAYRTWFIEMFGDDVRALLEPVELREPDITFLRRAELNLGELEVQLHHFGYAAHTGGDTVVFLPRQKIAFVGDLVPNSRFPILPDEDSSISGWIRTLDELAELGAETLVPSHGEVGEPELIAEVRDYLLAVRQRSGELRSNGVPLQEAQEELFEEFTRQHPDWHEPNWIRNAVERAYAEAAAR